jgi:nuclear transport factor 2 (NTF2) superfamily protein
MSIAFKRALATSRPILTFSKPQPRFIRMMASSQADTKPPLPPFTRETAQIKVKAAQDLWNTRDPHKVKNGYTSDSIWRNRSDFLRGTDEIVAWLTKKWERENGYRLRKELFSFTDNKVSARSCLIKRGKQTNT